MKNKILFLVILFQSFSFFLSAKETGRTIPSMRMHTKSFEEGTKVLSAGIGFGGYSYYGYNKNKYSYRNNTPLFIITYEQPYKKPVGPGLLGVGFYAGFRNSSSGSDHYINGNEYYSRHSWNHFLVAIRAAYHWEELTFDDFEVYFGAMLGLRVETYKYTSDLPSGYYNDYKYKSNAVNPAFGVFIGGRWYFLEKVGVFAEGGWGASYFNMGLSFKF